MAKLYGKGGDVSRALSFRSSDAEALVDVLYHAILGRRPDESGMNSYAGLIVDAPDRETLIAVARSIAMSEEAGKYRDHYLATR